MIDDLVKNWPLALPRTNKGTEFRKFLRVLADPYYRIGVDINTLYEERFIRSAHGTQLEYLGERVSILRQSGEGEEHYRRRIQVGHEAAAADGGWEDFANLVLSVLDCEPKDVDVTVDYQDQFGGVIVKTSRTVLEETQFSQLEAEEELEKAIPADRYVTIRTEDTFAFSGTQDGKGWGEGRWA